MIHTINFNFIVNCCTNNCSYGKFRVKDKSVIERYVVMKKIAVLTSGGDSPGMNAAVRNLHH
jgi:2-iminoacetate synthase ThiH